MGRAVFVLAVTVMMWGDVAALCFEERMSGNVDTDIRFNGGDHGDGNSFDGPGKTLAAHFKDEEKRKINVGAQQRSAADLCQDASIDTVTRTQDGSTYMFKGDYYWKINYNVTAPGYPRRISDDWDGLEGNLDASFTWPQGKTYFFKEGRYWSFTNKEMDCDYPKSISQGFRGIPDKLDAALVWSGNGRLYFFKGNQYWRYDVGNNPPVHAMYPLSITHWRGLSTDGIDAAFVWDNNNSYFFKGRLYYRFDDAISEVARNNPPYPYSTAVHWLSCRSR